MTDHEFNYSNLNDRPRGPFVTAAGLLLRGIPRVQAQARPFAQAWRRDNLAALAGTSPLWVALGDSLTQGLGASAHDRGWVGQARRRLANDGYDFRVVNLAISGARTSDVLERELPALERLPAPDLVTLMIGSNDLVRGRYRRGLAERFGEILHRLPRGAVVTTLPNPTRAAYEANAVIEQVARARGLVVADLGEGGAASWRGRLAADHFHPNEAGYASIAAALTRTIEAQLR